MSKTRSFRYVKVAALCMSAAIVYSTPSVGYAKCKFVPPTKNEFWKPYFNLQLYTHSNYPPIGDKLLHAEVREGDTEAVKTLMELGLDPNQWNSRGYTPLHLAADFGHLDIVHHLLDGGADPSIAMNLPEKRKKFDCQYTPLHTAAIAGHLEIVTALLGSGADPNPIDSWGNTPLHRAAYHGYTQIVSELLEGGADPSLKTNNGETALDKANRNQKFEAVVVLLKAEQTQ